MRWQETGEFTECRWGAGGCHDLDVVRMPKAVTATDAQCDRCGGSVAFKGRIFYRCSGGCKRFELCGECHAGQWETARSLFSAETHSRAHSERACGLDDFAGKAGEGVRKVCASWP